MMERYGNIFGVRFAFTSPDRVVEMVEQWIAERSHHYATFTTPHVVMLSRRDDALRHALAKATLTLPDGIGIVHAARLYGMGRLPRLPGPVLMPYLCDKGRRTGMRHYFYGGMPGIPELLAEKLQTMFPGMQVAGCMSPPFRPLSDEEKNDIVRQINDAAPDVVWVGLGAPKQEKWMDEHVDKLNAAALMGVGAAFDFHSGRIRRSPAWLSALGLEWIYRTLREPRRLGSKCLDGFVFMFGVLADSARMRLSK